MAQVTMQQVKELRERTQAGLNDCKSALVEAEGDIEKAVEVILKKGLAKSAKRAGAVASEGEVAVLIDPGGSRGVIVEVNIQTDFAARNADFKDFVQKVVHAASKAADSADLGGEPLDGTTVEEARKALVGRLGENITVRRWARLGLTEPGCVHSYVHMGGKIGVLLAVAVSKPDALGNDGLRKFVDDAAMQIAAMSPQYLRPAEVPEEAKRKQKDIFQGQLREQDKAPPEAAWPKIIEGKLGKWMKEICLLEQPSVMESDKSVDQVRADVAKAARAEIQLVQFIRYERGEGIEKPPGDDFADEVAKMAKG